MGCLCSAIPHNLPLGDRGIHLWNFMLLHLLSDLVVGATLMLIEPLSTGLAASQFCRNSLPADVRVWNVRAAGAVPHGVFAPRATWRVAKGHNVILSDVQALELPVDFTLMWDRCLWNDLLAECLIMRRRLVHMLG